MAEETQYTGNSGVAILTTANSNLNGTGTLATILTGASNGTLIKNLFIKLRVTSTSGMVRFYIDDATGSNIRLLTEVKVPARAQASTSTTFEARIPINFCLKAGYILKASIQNAQSTIVYAEGLNWAYYATSVRHDTTLYTANNGIAQISTANNTLTGGTTVQICAAGASASGFKGLSISEITIKGSVSVNPGMVRIWAKTTGAVKYVLWEIPVPTVTKSGTDQTFTHTIVFDNDFELPADWSLWASTELAENFNVIAIGNDWKYEA